MVLEDAWTESNEILGACYIRYELSFIQVCDFYENSKCDFRGLNLEQPCFTL